MTDDFDFSPLGEKFWRDAANACTHKPSEVQLRFAVCRHNGLTMVDSAARAGYTASTNDSMRIQGSRADKSTAVSELLAYAHAETGKGDDGTVNADEARRILSRIARRGDANARIKSLEALARMDAAQKEEQAAADKEPQLTHAEVQAMIICATPVGGFGAAYCLGTHFNRDQIGRISWFPFLQEVGPLLSRKFPEDWQRWRCASDKRGLEKELAFIDHCAAGPLLEGDALVAAVKDRVAKGFAGPFEIMDKVNAA